MWHFWDLQGQPTTLLPPPSCISVSGALGQASVDIGNHGKEGTLTVHETQLVIDKTQNHIHNGAELWKKTPENSTGVEQVHGAEAARSVAGSSL